MWYGREKKMEHEQQQSKKWFNLMIFMYNILNCWFYFALFSGGVRLYFHSTNIYCICWINPTTNTHIHTQIRIPNCKLIWMRCTTMAKHAHSEAIVLRCIAMITSSLAHFQLFSPYEPANETTTQLHQGGMNSSLSCCLKNVHWKICLRNYHNNCF